MKTLSKIILLCCIAVVTSAQAVVLFQNGFEAGSSDGFFKNMDDGYGQQRFGVFNITNAMRYKTAFNGVTPPQGSKMVEWNPPALPGGIAFYHGNLGSDLYKVRGQHRFMQASIKFWVGSGDLDDKELEILPDVTGSIAYYRTYLNLRTGAWRTLTGLTFGDRNGIASIHYNSWNTLSMTHDFTDWRMRVALNGATLAETESGFRGGPDGYIRDFYVTLAQKSDASSVYDPNVGGPQMYLDDYRVDAVPETQSIGSLSAGVVVMMAMRRRHSLERGAK